MGRVRSQARKETLWRTEIHRDTHVKGLGTTLWQQDRALLPKQDYSFKSIAAKVGLLIQSFAARVWFFVRDDQCHATYKILTTCPRWQVYWQSQ